MKIRNYKSEDCPLLARLFYDTVHSVNTKDYSKEQVDAWADGKMDLDAWNRSLLEYYTVVAETEGEDGKTVISGFGNMDQEGYLDLLYVHKDYQGRGTALLICQALEKQIKADTYRTHASITAKPFFQRLGFKVIKKQQVKRRGIWLTNYVMEKKRED